MTLLTIMLFILQVRIKERILSGALKAGIEGPAREPRAGHSGPLDLLLESGHNSS